jgi:hypothetical protein
MRSTKIDMAEPAGAAQIGHWRREPPALQAG